MERPVRRELVGRSSSLLPDGHREVPDADRTVVWPGYYTVEPLGYCTVGPLDSVTAISPDDVTVESPNDDPVESLD